MSDCEHIIENTLFTLLRSNDFKEACDKFDSNKVNQLMLQNQNINITTEQLMTMAYYVLYTFIDHEEFIRKKTFALTGEST